MTPDTRFKFAMSEILGQPQHHKPLPTSSSSPRLSRLLQSFKKTPPDTDFRFPRLFIVVKLLIVKSPCQLRMDAGNTRVPDFKCRVIFDFIMIYNLYPVLSIVNIDIKLRDVLLLLTLIFDSNYKWHTTMLLMIRS